MLKIIWKKKIRYELYTNYILYDFWYFTSDYTFYIEVNEFKNIIFNIQDIIDSTGVTKYENYKVTGVPIPPNDLFISYWSIGFNTSNGYTCTCRIYNPTTSRMTQQRISGLLYLWLQVN